MNKFDHIFEARKLLRREHSGVLSSNSLSMKGFPFGSITPFLMTECGDIVIYASDIAQHSRNMKADAKVSLCVFDATQDDSQASARVTFMAEAVADGVSERLQAQYFMLFPQARRYVNAHDFRFYLLKTQRVRYIGGFGDIFWFSKDDWSDQYIEMGDRAKSVIDHMHEDHRDALVAILAHFKQITCQPSAMTMLSCFAEGFHYHISGHHQHSMGFIEFLKPITKHYNVRQAMVELTQQSRQLDTAQA